MTDHIQSPAYYESQSELFYYDIFFEDSGVRGSFPRIQPEQQELIKGYYEQISSKSIEETGGDLGIWSTVVDLFMKRDIQRLLTLVIPANACKNPSMFESNSVRIDLAKLIASYGYNIHAILDSLGYVKNTPNMSSGVPVAIEVNSIDDLPDYLPQSAKEEIMRLKEQVKAGKNPKMLHSSGVIKVTENGTEVVSEEDFDKEHGEGKFKELQQEMEMIAAEKMTKTHDAPKTLQ